MRPGRVARFTSLEEGEAAVLGREIEETTVPRRCAQAPSSLGTGRSEGNARSGAVREHVLRHSKAKTNASSYLRASSLAVDTDESKGEYQFLEVKPVARKLRWLK